MTNPRNSNATLRVHDQPDWMFYCALDTSSSTILTQVR
jgi:hypothetical protein